jgi:hypothetical protein
MISLRTATKDDLRFVCASWFGHYRRAIHATPFDIYQVGMNARQVRIMATSTATIAYPDSTPDEIIGYIVRNAETLAFIYVKLDYRKNGAGRMLLREPMPKFYSHEPDKAWTRRWLERLGMSYSTKDI